MEYTKFSFGLRFAMTKDANLTEDDCWRVMFREISPELLNGIRLFGMWDDTALSEPEPAYICMLSNADLNTAKRLYAQIRVNYTLTSHLTLYRPYTENNTAEKCKDVLYLGQIEPDGRVVNGDVSYADMRFHGPSFIPRPAGQRVPRVLIAPDAISGQVTSADMIRRLTRAVAKHLPQADIRSLPVANGGPGTMDALVCVTNGRYLNAQLPELDGERACLRYGILPDRAIVFDANRLSSAQINAALDLPQNKGFNRYLVASGDGCVPTVCPNGVLCEVLSDRFCKNQFERRNILHQSGIETVLSLCEFDRHIAQTDVALIVVHAKEGVPLTPTADTLLYHCMRAHKLAVVLSLAEGKYYLKRSNDASAEALGDELSSAVYAAGMAVAHLSRNESFIKLGGRLI